MVPKPLDVGVFIPIGNDGWLISTTAPRYMPTFELNKEIVLKAESYGFDFALSMIKLRGFGGKTEHWDHNLESFTLMVRQEICHQLPDLASTNIQRPELRR
jgi:pyrimidine oxygenase